MSNEEFKRTKIDNVSIEEDAQIIEAVNIEDDTGPFPKIEHEEMKIDQTPQITEEMKQKIYVPTDMYGAFHYVLNKENHYYSKQ
jgi:hypothetical protein